MSAFRRNLTARSIDERLHSATAKQFLLDREKWRYVELTPACLENAEKYVSDFDVRALDAIHVASAMISRGRFPKGLPFITADVRQRTVAVDLGLDVIWVEG